MVANLYTLICEFAGGTYVSQVNGGDQREALRAWATLVRRDQTLGPASGAIADQACADINPPTALTGLANVWCWTETVGEEFILTNIVRSA